MRNKILYCVIVFFMAVTYACSSSLKRETVRDTTTIVGNFTVIFYGGRHIDELATLAVLDDEDDEYEFIPYGPEFDFVVKKHVTGQEALHDAISFLRHRSFDIRSIKNKQGMILGYELRPRIWRLRYGTPDVLDVNYSVRGKKVVLRIMLKPEVEKVLQGG